MKIIYSDIDGSSKSVREFIKSERIVTFVKDLPSVQFEFLIKRGAHPFIISKYANGYSKTISVRNLPQDDVLSMLIKCRDECNNR